MPKRSRSDANLENSDCGSTSDGASSDSDCSSSELRNLSETSRQRKRKLKRSRYLDGQSKGRYKSVEADSSPSEWNPNVCSRCSPVLQKYESTFKSLIHQGSNLRRRQHINPNPQRQAHYRDLNKQNEWLRNNIFDTLGNYLFCCKCVHSALGVSYQRLSRQRGIKRASSKEPIRRLTKAQVEAQGLGQYVLMPKEETLSFIRWWKSVSADQTVDVRYPHERHGLSGRVSHNAKTSVKDDFLQFIDSNSTPNGRSASSFGPTHYFSPKFTTIQTPKKGAKNFEQRVLTSIVGEFNRAQVDQERGTCSNYSASTWLKKHRPKHGIYPHKKDYCDTCAQLKADMKAKQTALNRIRQSGSATEHEQKELEASISTLENQLEEHKSEALSSQQNFNEAVSRCSQEWKIIEELEENGTDPDNLASHKHSFTLVISADYQMSKLIPHWGYSPQPGSTYYLQKLSHDIFGIVDHRENKSVVYTLDETVGPKNTDHTVSYLAHYLTTSVPDWVNRVRIFLDNTCSTNKNCYFMAWMMELVKSQTFDYVQASFMIAGHTKFCVDRLFSQIAQTFYHSDVFNTQELAEIISNYASVTVDNGEIVKPWRDALLSEYKKLPGIRSLHDFIVIRDPVSGGSLMNVRQHCYEGQVKVAWRGDPMSPLVRPEGTYSSLGRLRAISSTKMDNLKTMCTKFIPRERWLSCISP